MIIDGHIVHLERAKSLAEVRKKPEAVLARARAIAEREARERAEQKSKSPKAL